MRARVRARARAREGARARARERELCAAHAQSQTHTAYERQNTLNAHPLALTSQAIPYTAPLLRQMDIFGYVFPFFSPKCGCSHMHKYTTHTGRAIMYNEPINCVDSYTCEASFLGADFPGSPQSVHFTQQHLRCIGAQVCVEEGICVCVFAWHVHSPSMLSLSCHRSTLKFLPVYKSAVRLSTSAKVQILMSATTAIFIAPTFWSALCMHLSICT